MNRALAKYVPAALVLGTMIAGIGLAPHAANAQSPYFQDAQNRRHELVWSGDVDDTTIVSLHGGDVDVRDVRGKSSINVNSQVFGRLPTNRPVQVFLRRSNGRGEIRIVRQPNPNNNFTAAVRVKDWQPGRGHYFFVLSWRPLGPPHGF